MWTNPHDVSVGEVAALARHFIVSVYLSAAKEISVGLYRFIPFGVINHLKCELQRK